MSKNSAKASSAGVSGPSPGIGKSFVSSNFAQVLADSGKRVLLIDADLRNGSLHKIFGFPRELGLSEVVAGSLQLQDAVHRVSEQLHVLTEGQIPPNPSELLMSPRFRDLIETAAKSVQAEIKWFDREMKGHC